MRESASCRDRRTRFLLRAGVEQGVGGFELEGGGGEALGYGVVDLTCQPVSLLDRAERGAPGEEPRPLDGDAQEVTDRIDAAAGPRGRGCASRGSQRS